MDLLKKLIMAAAVIIIILIIYKKFIVKKEGFSLAYTSDTGIRGPYTGPCTPDGCSNFGCSSSTASAPCGPIRPGDDYIINPFTWPGSAWPAMSAAELVSMVPNPDISADKKPSAQEKFFGRKNTYIAKPSTCKSAAVNDLDIPYDNLSFADYSNNKYFNPSGSNDMGLACQSRETVLRASPTLDKACYSKLEDDPILKAKFDPMNEYGNYKGEDSLFSYSLKQNNYLSGGYREAFTPAEPVSYIPSSVVREFYNDVSNPDDNIKIGCDRNVYTGRFAGGSAMKFAERTK